MFVLMADDDVDDHELVASAFSEIGDGAEILSVENGLELLQYLRGEGEYGEGGAAPRPGLILLDLNMPKMDGREALKQIKADPDLRRIPVVVLTVSQSEEDIFRAYDNGISGYITKPVGLDGLLTAMDSVGNYWINIVSIPAANV